MLSALQRSHTVAMASPLQSVADALASKSGGGQRVETLMVDNYDSFTYNLVQYLEELGTRVTTVRNDQVSIAQIEAMNPQRIIISPGPGCPKDAGVSMEVIRYFAGKLPIFGVCLGLQCMYEAYGGTVTHAGEIVHGKASLMAHDRVGIFRGLPCPFKAVRYHSLAGTPETLPACLEVTCRTVVGSGTGYNAGKVTIQGVRHRQYCLEGVQFHPESILTEHGHAMLRNFLAWSGGTWAEQPAALTAVGEGSEGVEEKKQVVQPAPTVA